MAERLLFNIAGTILGKLGSPALQEFGLLWGVKDELDKLQNTVSAIKAVILDAEEKQKTNHGVRDWLEKLEVAVYEADDLLDDFSTEVLRRKVMTQNKRAKKVRTFFSRSNQLAFRFKMGHRVKVIRERLDDIAADRIKFHFTDGQEAMRVERREVQSVPYEENVLRGRYEDKNAIIKLLLESDIKDNVSVIPIVGIGGVGKSTLAQLVYNDEQVTEHFHFKVWVHVSDVFDLKLIAQKIIENAVGKTPERIKFRELKDQIKGKKYFLVLDDVWNEDPKLWSELRELLMGGARGSKILLTTRSQVVAKIMSTVSPYILSELSDSDSWDLFVRKAFRACPPNPTMEAIGREIVKKCVGVPLVISIVGGLLWSKDTEEEWLQFKDIELPEIAPTIFPTLKLSYDCLPPHLKRCFAYCSLFPKNHRIDKQTLIQLWIAQGFIPLRNERQRLEDVGDECFMDLFTRSFFKDVEMDNFGYLKSCKMHDLFHDLAQSIVGVESCAIGLDAADVVAKTRHVSISSIGVGTSREIPICLLGANKLRTLLLLIQQRELNSVDMDESKCNKTISSLKCLRVLDLHGLGLKKVPRSVGKASHLRYLDLSNNSFQLLPKCICRLPNLQTLKLNDCEYLKELPRDTKNMVSLRHLEIDGCGNLSHMPHGLGQLSSLQTLRRFVVGGKDKSTRGFSRGLKELDGLVNLRGELRIERLRGSVTETREKHPIQYYLCRLKFLEWLILSWDSNEPDDADSDAVSLFESLRPEPDLKKLSVYGYGGVIFPRWRISNTCIWYFPCLVEISMQDCNRCQRLPPFGLLPSLQVLKLDYMSSLEYIYKEEDYDSSSPFFKAQGLFPSLKRLHLDHLLQLKGLGSRRREAVLTETASSSSFRGMTHFTALEHLYIDRCPQLDLSADDEENGVQFQSLRSLTHLSINRMPLVSLTAGLQYLTSLQSLLVERCSSLVALPESIGNLTSLRHLHIRYCDSLTSLPDYIASLTILQDLAVIECHPLLIERCQEETGEDWPKIAHIPTITLRRDGSDEW